MVYTQLIRKTVFATWWGGGRHSGKCATLVNYLLMYLHPYTHSFGKKRLHQAAYFYMPANEERPAELIEILNSDRTYIHVPMRDGDVTLDAFLVRDMTEAEIQNFSGSQTWQIFQSWDELQEDHHRYKVSAQLLRKLAHFKQQFPLAEGMAA